MTPHNLTLKGFRGIRDGLGCAEIVLDLDALTGDAALICLSGPNGTGKSTVLDNLHPYRIMPSRANSLNPAGFSFYEHLCAAEGEKDLEWGVGGERYRAVLRFQQNMRRRCDARLYLWRNAAWCPVQLPDGTVSDGRTDTYDRCVNALLGNPETFFTAVFSAQNRRPLAGYANGEIKALMVDLLGLDDIEATGDKVTDVVRGLTHDKDGLHRELSGYAQVASDLVVLQQALRQAEQQAQQHDLARIHAKARQHTVQATLLQLREEQIRLEATEHQRRDLLRQREALRHAVDPHRTDLETALHREVHRRHRIEAQLAKRDADFRARRGAWAVSMAAAQRIASRQAEIDQAKVDHPKLTHRKQALIEEIVALRAQVTRRDALMRTQEHCSATRQALSQDLASITHTINALQAQGTLLQAVPCIATPYHAQCRLLTAARTAQEQLPHALAQRERVAAALDHAQSEQRIVAATLATFGEVDSALSQHALALDTLLEEIGQLDSLLALAPSVIDAVQQLDAIRLEQESVTRAASEERAALESELQEVIQLIEQTQSRIANRLNLHDAQLAALQTQIDALPPGFDEARLRQAQAQVDAAEEDLARCEGLYLQAQTQCATLRAQQVQKHTLLAHRDLLQQQLAALSHELAFWRLLAKAFSKDGIIALSIDDVGPTLSALANDLLCACYGPRFSLSIQTQVESATGALREGFEILVHDSSSDTAKALGSMSGGERVWIQEALTRAIALYLAQSSGRQYETLFSDEVDGPLDPERKRLFGAMKREVLRLGGFSREIFVTQSPELAHMADVMVGLEALVGESKIIPVAASQRDEPRENEWNHARNEHRHP